MTQSEKDALVAAFISLKPMEVDNLAAFHDNNFDLIHFNLRNPGYDATKDVFFAWHRYQMLTMEHAMQALNPRVSLPFWDWTLAADRVKTSPLWASGFMGGFDETGSGHDWNLGRNPSPTYTLPTTSNVNYAQAFAYTPSETLTNRRLEFHAYSAEIENNRVHVGGHAWTGGVMASGSSPGDPIFYLHHTMVDKLWQDWIEANAITTASDIYIKNTLPNWPSVDPDNIVDSKTIGVFYADADNDIAILSNYSVNNDFLTEEVFYYQYLIEAKDNFIIPTGKVSKIESVNEVILKPGFHAQSGSTFTAKIDTDNDINTASKTSNTKRKTTTNTVTGFRILDNVYLQKNINKDVRTIIYVQQKNILGLEFKDECENCKVEILDSQNNIILNKILNNGTKTDIDLSALLSGDYSVKIFRNNILLTNKNLRKL